MADQYIGEIRIFGFNVPPRGWAYCNGQLLSISQNTALFSLLGTYYGGDGKTTFALPDLQGSAPIDAGQGSGLSFRDLGEVGGEQVVTLLTSEMPNHAHNLRASSEAGDLRIPSPARALAASSKGSAYQSAAPNVQMAPDAVTLTGGSQPHNNMQPYLTLNFCIALQGVYPPRG
jgi:microcystin-dependent protein